MKDKVVVHTVHRKQTSNKVTKIVKMLRAMQSHFRSSTATKKSSKIKRTARDIIPDGEQYAQKRAEIQALFDMFDVDKSNSIDIDEFLKLLKMMKMANTMQEAQLYMREIDHDNSHAIEFDEFFDWMLVHEEDAKSMDLKEMIGDIHKMLCGNDGKITASSFSKALDGIGCTLRPDEIHNMIMKLDEDGDGNVTEEELLKFLRH